MKVNNIESKFEHEAAGFSAQAVGSLFVCLFVFLQPQSVIVLRSKWFQLGCSL